MFSVIFPGQGSQIVGMGKEFYDKFELVKSLFKEADETLNYSISKLILKGPKEELDLTANTQPAIFLISYSIFNVIKKEFNVDLNKAKYFAGHSLGEYSALSCAGYLNFAETLKILRIRGDAMQNSVPKGEGGMVAVLGSTVEAIEKILKDNETKFLAQIANDNSEGQIVLSGKTQDLEKLTETLKDNSIKNIKLPVSAPFHCSLMSKATEIMTEELNKISFSDGSNKLISNVTNLLLALYWGKMNGDATSFNFTPNTGTTGICISSKTLTFKLNNCWRYWDSIDTLICVDKMRFTVFIHALTSLP